MEPVRRLPPTSTERASILTEDMVAGTGQGGTRTARPIRHEDSGAIPGTDLGGTPPMGFAHDYYAEVSGGLLFRSQEGPLTLVGSLSADDSGGCTAWIDVLPSVVGMTLLSLTLTPRYSGPAGPVGDATNWLDDETDPTTWSVAAYQGSGLNMSASSESMPHTVNPSIVLYPTGLNAAVTSEPIIIAMSCPTSRGFQPDFINDGGTYTLWIDVVYGTGVDTPTEYVTTYLPCPYSEDVEVNGLRVRRGDAWRREDGQPIITVQNPTAFYVGPSPWNVSIHYAYYTAAAVEPAPPET